VCILTDKTGEPVGEGRGTFQAKNPDDTNKAAKMAKKRAKVDAVLDAYGLSDLFTQDIEDGLGAPPKNANPPANPDAPAAEPRAQRDDVSQDQVKALFLEWRNRHPDGGDDNEFGPWVRKITGQAFAPAKAANWTLYNFNKCCDSLKETT
jgi:hypothetical protein